MWISRLDKPQASKVLYSDIDGTLAHYLNLTVNATDPVMVDGNVALRHDETRDTYSCNDSETGLSTTVISLPMSSTGLRAWISLPTLRLLSAIRDDNIPVVIISGARTSTIIQRLPYLPLADCVSTENGGRIFHADGGWQTCCPLREDFAWRAKHDGVAGPAAQEGVAAAERVGPLWDAFRSFKAMGFKLDVTSYSTCFRVSLGSCSQAQLDEQLSSLPAGLTSTINLGKADVYPSTSGKDKAAEYLAEYYGVPLSQSAYLCDDDNDIALSRLVGKAYCPSLGSTSMGEEVKRRPEGFFVSPAQFVFGAEEAIQALCKDWGVALPASAGGADTEQACDLAK